MRRVVEKVLETMRVTLDEVVAATKDMTVWRQQGVEASCSSLRAEKEEVNICNEWLQINLNWCTHQNLNILVGVPLFYLFYLL